MAERQIAYLWVSDFGVAVARRAEPRLTSGPLALLDEHGHVRAVDALAGQAGISLGLSERQAAARSPQATLLPAARFPIEEAQARFLRRIKSYTDRWQPDGLGRVYLDATGRAASAPSVSGREGGQEDRSSVGDELLDWCQALTAAVRGMGWGPSLGVTGSKFGARVAGQVVWQNAALLLAPAAQRDFLMSQPVNALPLDADTLGQLRHLGIRTLGQYARLPATGVLTRFGQPGRTAQRWAQGLDDRPVIPPWEAPEVTGRVELDAPLADRERLLAVLARLAEKLLAPLRDRLQAISAVRLAVTRGDGRTISVGHAFPLPTAAGEPVRLAMASLLERVAWDGQGAVELGLTLAGITDTPEQQLALFDLQEEATRARLSALLERLATRFGADAFRLASLADPDNLLPERRAAFGPWR